MAGRAGLWRGRRVAVAVLVAFLFVAVPAWATAPQGAPDVSMRPAEGPPLSGAKPVRAELRSVPAKQARVRRALDEIDWLDVRLEATVEAYNGATSRLARTKRDRAAHRRQLVFARRQLAIAQRRLGERLRAIYTSGEDDSTLAILLGSESPADFIDRWETVSSIAAHDRQVFAEVAKFERQATRQDLQLEKAAERQKRLIAEQAAAIVRIEAGLRKRRALASSIEGDLARLGAEERIRQKRLRMEAMRWLSAHRGSQLRALQAAGRRDLVGASAVSPDGAVTVAPPSSYSGVVGIAMRYLGVPYVWGGASPEGFDCSGLTMYAYAKVGVSLPHYAAYQFMEGVPVSRSDLQPGDLVFFHKLDHVGMYIGDGYFICPAPFYLVQGVCGSCQGC